MVAPSCCLEYRPTGYFWLILFFGVFPAIYLCGKVVGCFLTVLLRVLRGLCRFLLWDEVDYEEAAKMAAQEQEREIRRLVEERETEREERRRKRKEEKKRARELAQKQTLQTNGKASKIANGTTRDVIIEEKHQPSDNSDSLISECEDEISQATSGVISEPTTSSAQLRHRNNLNHKVLQ